ncbi:FecR family protein [Chitinophaga ginsengisegetis]|uniref:FecR family protein n=1 Tax=Chitinophaga ginsengisegetis TaxID=393003 RepID=UPI000DBA829D|nr:FecR domain-containing protein [Chitinophaga ginsengisegetis]MDR6570583.1 ferric-dicitrate binding protein FerR (iron transport regulator) [Chitinophaga ginsengisegetis]MDR6650317.1 ferric-dicitrate binding protein FerR (iron transport regulator) [Chitinophaga ginsengisegetis]MDR6656564.1 ferric-dicitrate binding protein FerR (iron transport regulator) [Chitinophaga ginsengisegetis]
MNETDFNTLLELYLEGKCTPEQKEWMEQWFDSLSEEGSGEELPANKELVMQRLKNRIDGQIKRQNFFNLPVLLRVAASVIVILSLGTWAYLRYQSTATVALQYVTRSAARGQQLKVTLPDGSMVTLNAGSGIRYPENFKENRTVTLLEGEACFDVTTDQAHPFTVTSNGIQTAVLGTVFNVQAYKALDEITVTVIRGKVAVETSSQQKPLLVLPDEQAVISSATGSQQKRKVNAAAVTGWVTGKLAFRNETLQHVAVLLENIYDVKIVFKDEATKGIRFTANFSSTDSLEKILFAIAKANKLNWSIRNKVVQF